MMGTHLGQAVKRAEIWVVFLIWVAVATLYGLSDEFHQAFVAARQADGYDLLADFMGSIIGATGYLAATHKNGPCRFSKKGR